MNTLNCVYESSTNNIMHLRYIVWMGCVARTSMDITMTTSASVDSPSNRRSPVQTTSRPAAFHECKQPPLCQPFNRRSQWRQSAVQPSKMMQNKPKGDLLFYFLLKNGANLLHSEIQRKMTSNLLFSPSAHDLFQRMSVCLSVHHR